MSSDGAFTPGAGNGGAGYSDGYWANRVGVITGAGSGIGEAMALACAERGMNVVLADISEEQLERVGAECDRVRQSLAEMGGNAGRLHLARSGVTTLICDVTDRADLQKLHDTAYDTYGAVHLVHNNAGAMGPRVDSILDISEEQWDWFMDLNMNSVLHGCRLFAKSMHVSGEDGFIINTSSIYGLASASSAYGITKQTVIAISEAFQQSLKSLDSKVQVSALMPSFISTNLVNSNGGRDGMVGDAAAWMNGILADGPGPEFVAKCVFSGIENGDHYIHTHPDVSEQMFQDRVEGILGTLKVTTDRHDAEMERIGKEAGLLGGRPTKTAAEKNAALAVAEEEEEEEEEEAVAVGDDFAQTTLVRRSKL